MYSLQTKFTLYTRREFCRVISEGFRLVIQLGGNNPLFIYIYLPPSTSTLLFYFRIHNFWTTTFTISSILVIFANPQPTNAHIQANNSHPAPKTAITWTTSHRNSIQRSQMEASSPLQGGAQSCSQKAVSSCGEEDKKVELHPNLISISQTLCTVIDLEIIHPHGFSYINLFILLFFIRTAMSNTQSIKYDWAHGLETKAWWWERCCWTREQTSKPPGGFNIAADTQQELDTHENAVLISQEHSMGAKSLRGILNRNLSSLQETWTSPSQSLQIGMLEMSFLIPMLPKTSRKKTDAVDGLISKIC